jgi:hypothetical protein
MPHVCRVGNGMVAVWAKLPRALAVLKESIADTRMEATVTWAAG